MINSIHHIFPMTSLEFPLDITKYELRKVIGRGATATVYAAKCITNGKEVAIKQINLEVCPIEIENLRTEIAFWSSCDHQNIVKYYGSFIEKSILYIIMEYMNMGSMSEIIKFGFRKGIPKESVIGAILRGVLNSLVYFHDNSKIHRDVKTGNILINQQGDVKMGDFGIAANLVEGGQRVQARFTVIGTPCYMAPEVIVAQKGYSEKADIWSLGITAIELALGSAPYSTLYPLEVIVRISNSPPPSLPDDQQFSQAFRDFVKSALQKAPEKRPSAQELLNSKFIKQAATPKEMAELFGHIPTIEEQYELTHNATVSNLTQKKPDGIKAEWDFSLIDNDTPEIDISIGDEKPDNIHSMNHINSFSNYQMNQDGSDSINDNSINVNPSDGFNNQPESLPTVVQKGKFRITTQSSKTFQNGIDNTLTPPQSPSSSKSVNKNMKSEDETNKNDEILISDMKNRMKIMKEKISALKHENEILKTQLDDLYADVKQYID
ncbi:STE20/SPS1-related proline-alanine-rich protein kinase [Tritrichomonas foetus]|uniref:non-specific serine/threonine protein kinase n=1 Tax=Tritrichomonas foetus TaxID=1144522 RepID=A0A1J4J6D7_9EUKA|nr:STE20/SPS1-related proline-alanine-rich protein kinase [Tritrichomonas foetus]|eukprot:OHS94225.1 STE20/SPS1-related proline-alanine-rich protein kinase [Tritrichomonas foetus]